MKISAYLLLAFVVFISFLLIFAPVSPLWSMVQSDVAKTLPGLKVLGIRGSIWNGISEIQFRQLPPSRVNWEIATGKLLTGSLSVAATATGEGHSLDINTQFSHLETQLDIHKGEFDSNFVNRITNAYGLSFTGDLVVEETTLDVIRDGSNGNKITDAHGRAHWSGGSVMVAGRTQPLVLPSLDGKLSFTDQLLTLDITHEQRPILKITLKDDGWATIAIKGKFFDLANLPRPDGTNVDETILLLEEKIL